MHLEIRQERGECQQESSKDRLEPLLEAEQTSLRPAPEPLRPGKGWFPSPEQTEPQRVTDLLLRPPLAIGVRGRRHLLHLQLQLVTEDHRLQLTGHPQALRVTPAAAPQALRVTPAAAPQALRATPAAAPQALRVTPAAALPALRAIPAAVLQAPRVTPAAAHPAIRATPVAVRPAIRVIPAAARPAIRATPVAVRHHPPATPGGVLHPGTLVAEHPGEVAIAEAQEDNKHLQHNKI